MPDYSLAELVALSGIPSRTIRYYITEGLIPSPGREGPGTRYPDTTLAKLRLIARLRDAHQPLATIRDRLDALTEADLFELSNAAPAAPADSALEYIRSVLGEPPARLAAGITVSEPAPAARAFFAVSMPMALVPAAMPAPGMPVAAQPLPAATPLAAQPDESSTAASAPAERSQWERIALASGIELHVRRPQSRRENRMVERLIAFARQLQGEDQL